MIERIEFSTLLSSITLLSGLVFSHVLIPDHRNKYWIENLLGLLLLIVVRFVMGGKIHGEDSVASVFLEEILCFGILIITMKRSCDLNMLEATYLSCWSIVSYNAVREIFEVLRFFSPFVGIAESIFVVICELGQIILLCLLWKPASTYVLPEKKLRVGPRQTTSAVTLTILFLLVFGILHSVDSIREFEGALLTIYVLLQIYYVSLLAIQVSLFQKSAMQKELETVQLLIRKQKQQYVIAKQNIQLINRRCHDLKQIIYKLQKEGDPDSSMMKTLQEAEEAANIYDAVVKTGNEVLDTVLTDKSLLCEEEKIKISCVADGEILSFMEPTDIYTIFDGGIDYTMTEVKRFPDEHKRFIDVLIHEKNHFAIINIMCPIFEAKGFENGLPVPRGKTADDRTLSLKMIREILRRYDGILNVEIKNAVLTLRIVIPK